jgi:hypothetical protein
MKYRFFKKQGKLTSCRDVLCYYQENGRDFLEYKIRPEVTLDVIGVDKNPLMIIKFNVICEEGLDKVDGYVYHFQSCLNQLVPIALWKWDNICFNVENIQEIMDIIEIRRLLKL